MKQYRSTKSVSNRGQRRSGFGGPKRSCQKIRSRRRNRDVHREVDSVARWVGKKTTKENQLARVEYAGRTIAYHRHSIVAVGIPQRDFTAGPLGVDPLKKRIVQISRVPKSADSRSSHHRPKEPKPCDANEYCRPIERRKSDNGIAARDFHQVFRRRIQFVQAALSYPPSGGSSSSFVAQSN